jgi:hypothetical protein
VYKRCHTSHRAASCSSKPMACWADKMSSIMCCVLLIADSVVLLCQRIDCHCWHVLRRCICRNKHYLSIRHPSRVTMGVIVSINVSLGGRRTCLKWKASRSIFDSTASSRVKRSPTPPTSGPPHTAVESAFAVIMLSPERRNRQVFANAVRVATGFSEDK